MTRAWFERQLARLAGLRFPPADLETHWEALRALPEAILEAAVGRALRTRREFPSPVELLEDADLVAPHVAPPAAEAADRTQELETPIVVPVAGVPPIRRVWRYYCEACSDSGWVSCWCAGVDTDSQTGARRTPWAREAACGRERTHGAHAWVTPCACRETNPWLRRQRERERRWAADRAARTASRR